jgi:GumC protein
MIDQAPLDVVDLQDVLSRAVRSDTPVADHTQLDLLQSRRLAETVIRELRLQDEAPLPDADPAASASGAFDPRLVDRYVGTWLEIIPLPESRLVTVAISTPDPELSARVANAHAQAYVRYGLDLRTQASRRAVQFLQGTLDELRGRANKSAAAL